MVRSAGPLVAIHTITLENGLSFDCPDDRPILYAALEQGVSLPFRCRSGACGSCRAHLCQAYALSDCQIRLEAARDSQAA